MKRYLPIVFCLLALIFVNANVIKQQRLITNGQIMFVKLRPVDPRSLFQGDYMALSYDLYIDPDSQKVALAENAKVSISLLDYRMAVTLNDEAQVVSSTFTLPEKLAANQRWLIVKRDADNRWRPEFYPASNSFLFAEGLAYCYENAVYAELRVNESGRPLLYRLTDENKEPLNCESKSRDESERLESIF